MRHNIGQRYRIAVFPQGTPLENANLDRDSLGKFGRFLASMDRRLQDTSTNDSELKKIDFTNFIFIINNGLNELIKSTPLRKILSHYFLRYLQNAAPLMPLQRAGVIYDAADDFVISDGCFGISGKGRLGHGALVLGLGRALPSALIGQEDPAWAAGVVAGAYHSVFPLREKELLFLYDTIAASACAHICQRTKNQEENIDHQIIKAESFLKKWIAVNPVGFTNLLKEACGFPLGKPVPTKDLLARRHQHISPSLSVSYQNPIALSGAAFQYMYAADGSTFLDAYNNIPLVGHSHPEVVAAGQRQMAELNTNTRYLYDNLHEYTEALLKKFPPVLNKIFFVNSGSAASDLALRMAFAYCHAENIIVLENAYHGNTHLGIRASPYKFDGKGGGGTAVGITKLPMPDTFRGKYKGNTAGHAYAQDAIRQIEATGRQVGAFIAEPIMGCGGQVILPKGYLKEVYQYIRSQGGLCIADEVQIGFGRVGTHFWGFEQHGVVPDMVILGKPMGNGHPMAAVVCTDAVAEAFDNGMEFFSSFGGNPVSCAIGLSVLRVLEEEGLQARSLEVGSYILQELRGMMSEFPLIGDVRGSGLFWGMEMMRGKQPATDMAHALKNHLRKRHILISTDGPHNNVLKSKPPLCFDMENAARLLGEVRGWLQANRG